MCLFYEPLVAHCHGLDWDTTKIFNMTTAAELLQLPSAILSAILHAARLPELELSQPEVPPTSHLFSGFFDAELYFRVCGAEDCRQLG